MGLGVVDGGIAHHVQAIAPEAAGEGLGVADNGALIRVPELVHFIGRHQHTQLGAQMMVGDASGEGAAFDGLPQAVFQVLLLIVHADDAPLGTEEGLVGGAGDDLRALLEGVLEVIADKAQHMGHVVHDGGGDLLLIHKLPDLGHRLLVQDHGLAEDDQFRTIAVQELLGLLHIHLIGVIPAHGEVHHGGLLGDGVHGDVVVQSAHGLGGQVTALDDVVVHDVAQALGVLLAVEAVFPVHQGGEHRHVGHLAAEGPGLHLGAAEIGPHLLGQHPLHLVDELGALIIEHLLLIEGQDLLVLGIAAGRVAAGQQAHGPAGGILRGDQVHALLLPPDVVLNGLVQQSQGLAGAVASGHGADLLLLTVQQGAGEGRRAHAHVPGGDHGLEPLAPDVHLHGVIHQHVAVDIAQTDGPLAAGLQDHGGQALALGLEIGHHGAAGDPAHQLVASIDFHPSPHDAPVQQGDGGDPPGQGGHVGEVPVHVADKCLVLTLQSGAADEIPLLGGEAHGKLGQRHGEDGDLGAVGGNAHLVAVQGEGCLHPQGIPCAQTRRTRAQLHQTVPQPHHVLAADVYLVAQRLAGVAGLGDAGLAALQGHGAQGVLGGLLGGGLAAGEGHEHFLALGALDGDGGPFGADVGDGAVEARQRPVQMLQILVDVGGVDHQQIAVLLEQVQIRVVHGAAVLVGNDAVLGHVQVQSADVAGQHMLEKFLALGPLDQQAAHVGHVEQAAHLAGVQMLGDDAGRILDGHFPPAEVHHGGPGGNMHVVQLRALQFAHFLSSSFKVVPSCFWAAKKGAKPLPCAPVS